MTLNALAPFTMLPTLPQLARSLNIMAETVAIVERKPSWIENNQAFSGAPSKRECVTCTRVWEATLVMRVLGAK